MPKAKENSRVEKFQEYLENCKELRNLTPHDINFLISEDSKLRYEPYGETIRIPTEFQNIGEYNGIEVTRKVFRKGVSLPEFEEGVLNIVSSVVGQYVAENHPERVDFVTIGKVIRDGNGHIQGVKNFGFME
jgi:hypothetical protein